MRTFALLGLLLAACPGQAQPFEPRGPFALHDEHLLAQARLTLAPVAARTLAAGRSDVRIGVRWSNTFAWSQDVPGETPRTRRYLLDGEVLTADVELRRGLRDGLDVGLRLPVQWRGGGALDGFIDGFHRAFRFAGVGDGERPSFRRDAWRVLGRTRTGAAFAWSDEGVGLGNLDLEARARLGRGRGRAGHAALLRAALPTGTPPFDGNGWSLGAQLVTTRACGTRAVLHAGAGLTYGGSRRVRGVGYTRLRAQAFATLERRLGARASLLLGSELASRLVRDVDGFAGLHSTVHAGVWVDMGKRTGLALALVENVAAQAATADLTLHAGLSFGR